MAAGALLSIKITGDKEVRARWAAMPDTVFNALSAEAQRQGMLLQRHVVNDKLSGQVLGVRTGALRRSIQVKTTVSGRRITVNVFSAGDVKYAAFWEFGFHGIEEVRAHIRTIAFGRPVQPFLVGPYQRHVDQPARPYMRPALAEMEGSITAALRKTAAMVMSGARLVAQ